jgi:type I restriction enzyme R subunit
VADDGSVHGLAGDYASLHDERKNDRDRFQLHLSQALINAIGETAASSVSIQLHTVDGHDLCRVHVPPSTFPVEAHVVVDRRGQLERKTAFYVRIGNATREITDVAERQRYVQQRWVQAQRSEARWHLASRHRLEPPRTRFLESRHQLWNRRDSGR